MDEDACNFNPVATISAECEYTSCAGCTDTTACNYEANATINDGTCTYQIQWYNCDGTCLDLDGDEVCDIVDDCIDELNDCEIYGCTNPSAINYNPDATIDDESCFLVVEGCMDTYACNYNSSANTDDGSCYNNNLGCGCDEPAPELYYDCDNNCLVDADNDNVCDELEIPGCTNPSAINYNPNATDENGSCDYIVIEGCTNPDACNYDLLATEDDGSCDYSCLCFSDTVFVPVLDTIVLIDTVEVEIIITEYLDCSTGMPCGAAMEELLDKSKFDGKIYNLLGQEINRREGIYIEGGQVKYKIQ